MPKLKPNQRKRTIPCTTQLVKLGRTCELSAKLRVGSEASKRQPSRIRRLDAIRSLHKLTGDHEEAKAVVSSETSRNRHQTIDTARVDVLERIVDKLNG